MVFGFFDNSNLHQGKCPFAIVRNLFYVIDYIFNKRKAKNI